LLAFLLFCGCGEQNAPKVIILGIDGMDCRITDKLMDAGHLPNFKALGREGSYSQLGTSIPPQSPVAWSNFITGMNPGGHGIYDFLHEEWEDGNIEIVDSIASSEPVTSELSLFGYTLPLAGGAAINKRRGTAFWEVLEEHGIPATVFKIPSNFPPTPTGQNTLSGMGTPDIQGGYGVYYAYTDNEDLAFSDKIDGGKVVNIRVADNKVADFLYGPENIAIEGDDKPITTTPLTVYIDPSDPVVKIVIGDEESDPTEIILKQGEWSEFVEMEFEIIPYLSSVSGITRFYLKQVRPDFTLFVDPININPCAPSADVSTPSGWVTELAERNGPFYTKGMPDDTKALEEGVLTYDEYRKQALLVFEKRKQMLFDLLSHHDSGVLFYYFCSLDLNSHMFWRCMDEKHPGYSGEFGSENENFIEWLYKDIDKIIGKVRDVLDEEDTLIVMSDHGFAPYYRSFNMNTWLLENGYAVLKEDADREADQYFASVDWAKTRAYNLGFTGLYLNVKNTDKNPNGAVEPENVDSLTDEICSRLLREKDPDTGENIFLRMYKAQEIYSGEALPDAPQIIIGCRRKYRISNESAQGMYPRMIIRDNLDPWSGSHLMAAEEVPGVLFCNRRILVEDPKLFDLTVSVLKKYGIDKLPGMVGRPVLAD